ncbi:MAG TPA: helix-turn-helix domain-containing protein [Candidatus Eisenbacteria bacterium]|nr:helix-turn-helix domain-containing protein [Candidatus Eisenbacteria bacterium]
MVDSAELFEAISHPVRIRILKILEKQPASFASLKRQLGIESSGNLDYHLKKLTQLIAVRENGLYGLTDAGKEALLSIGTIELWTETEKRKIKTPGKLPLEASLLILLEASTVAVAILWFLLAPSTLSTLSVISISAVIASLGVVSIFGILTAGRWSWKMVIAKSGMMMLGGLIPLSYLSILLGTSRDVSADMDLFYTTGILYIVFIVLETVSVFLALRSPVRDYLGAKTVTRLPHRALLGGVASIASGALMTVGMSFNVFSLTLNGGDALDLLGSAIFIAGLAVGIGGVLILLRSYTLGALMSIIFGLFPSLAYYQAAQVVQRLFGGSNVTIVLSAVLGLLPVIGGILALVSMRKIRD